VGVAPLVIAHRGASAQFPEHTEAALRAALDQGADVVEVDVLPCADGVLVARHDRDLTLTTCLAEQRDAASRLLDDLTSVAVRGLRARERWPLLRAASAAHDDRWPVLTLSEVLALVGEQARRLGRPVGVAIELKNVQDASRRGHDVVAAMLADLDRAGMPAPQVPVWVLAFEPAALAGLDLARRRGAAAGLHLVRLVEGAAPTVSEWDAIEAQCEVVGVALDLLLVSAGAHRPTALLDAARRRGLAVWGWTFRAENAFLPAAMRSSPDPADTGDLDALLAEAFAAGLDGLVTDEPAWVVRARSLQS
jgi:glycerophosphoryl diester phosphodiesterase